MIGELATPVVTRLFQLPGQLNGPRFRAGWRRPGGRFALYAAHRQAHWKVAAAVFHGSISLAITITMLPVLALLTSILGAGIPST